MNAQIRVFVTGVDFSADNVEIRMLGSRHGPNRDEFEKLWDMMGVREKGLSRPIRFLDVTFSLADE